MPEAFKENMKALLKDEYTDFVASYDSDRQYGLRCNTLKSDLSTFKDRMPFDLTPVPWAGEGFYYKSEDRPGRHPLHEAGAYYIQESSAMSAVSVLDPKPGDHVLDLCAAPGGKSSQIAGRLQNSGLLVSNEINRQRSEILSENIERMGVRNCVVLNESPASLSARFIEFFDKILVDAPCSGEGMFRKDETARTEWSPENTVLCAARQSEILDCAASMLRPGGTMVYSTCTFNPGENEQTIAQFIDRHPEFSIEASDMSRFFDEGRPEWADGNKDLTKTMRLWPHKLEGEGHFVALLRKTGIAPSRPAVTASSKPSEVKLRKELTDFLCKEAGLKSETADRFLTDTYITEFGDNIYLTPASFRELSGLKIQRPGLHAAVRKKNRLEPAHSLAMALKPDDARACIELSFDEATKYLHGETINCNENLKGWIPVFYEGFSTGYGKAAGGILKNHYPKGLRI